MQGWKGILESNDISQYTTLKLPPSSHTLGLGTYTAPGNENKESVMKRLSEALSFVSRFDNNDNCVWNKGALCVQISQGSISEWI